VGFGDDGMGITQINEWYNRFKDAHTSVEVTLVLVGPQQAEMTSSLTKCRLCSCRTIMSPSENLRRRGGISTGSVHSILTNNLALRKVSVKFMPKLIQTFFAKHNIPVVRQAPYSPDMAPCDY